MESPYATKLPKCEAPNCNKAGSHGWPFGPAGHWCINHKEPQHVLLIKP